MEQWLYESALWLSNIINPVVHFASGTSLLILLLLSFFRRTRQLAGRGFLLSYYLFGLGVLLFSVAVSLLFAGLGWMIGGLLLCGIGVLPVAIIAAFIKGHWQISCVIAAYAGLAYGFRLLGFYLADRSEGHHLELDWDRLSA